MQIHVFKKTTDNWCGNYHVENDCRVSDLVEVSCITLPADDGEEQLYRVCVWGNDDMGLERDYQSEKAALASFHQIICMECVNQDSLRKEFGFWGA